MNTKALLSSLTPLRVWHHLSGRQLEPVRNDPVRKSSAQQAWTRFVEIPKGAVISFTKESEAENLTVFRGSLWLTETPGSADVVLETSDEHALGPNRPVVVQALADSVIAWT